MSATGKPTIQDIYAAMTNDEVRNRIIADDVTRAVEQGRSPLVLTGRTEHLVHLEATLAGGVQNIVVLKGGMGCKQRREISERLAAIPESEPRLILATGSYIGEGFDDARLDTFFWRCQFLGRELCSSMLADYTACTKQTLRGGV